MNAIIILIGQGIEVSPTIVVGTGLQVLGFFYCLYGIIFILWCIIIVYLEMNFVWREVNNESKLYY